MATKIVVDSGADLPLQMREECDITVVPLTVHFGNEEYRDGIDLSNREFYRKLRESDEAHTSQPSPGNFYETYQRLSADGSHILSFHLSSRLSGTVQSAQLGAKMLEQDVVTVVDTFSASMGIGLPALAAARALGRGQNRDEALQIADRIIKNQRIFFIVDTLEYLRRNGRIGKAASLVGTLLNIKPILTIEEGLVAPREKVRGRRLAERRLQELVKGEFEGKKTRLAVVHADAAERAEELAEWLRREVDPLEVVVVELGATIGTHVGPGTLGVVGYPSALEA